MDQVQYTSDARVVCDACADRVELVCATERARPKGYAIAALLIALVPFGLSFSEASWSSANGVVTSYTYRDWFAIVGGTTAAVLGAFHLYLAWRSRAPRSSFLLGVAALALGAVQLARGFGMFWSPPA
jgi:hypothetical protein